jgi:elongator complex protein 2
MPSSSEGKSTWTLAASIKLDEGVCAVDAISISGGREILAIGTESGRIWLYELSSAIGGDGGMKETLLLELDER